MHTGNEHRKLHFLFRFAALEHGGGGGGGVRVFIWIVCNDESPGTNDGTEEGSFAKVVKKDFNGPKLRSFAREAETRPATMNDYDALT